MFIARDHHIANHLFSLIKNDSRILVLVIGVRFELNDPYIYTIGKLLEKLTDEKQKKKPITIVDDE